MQQQQHIIRIRAISICATPPFSNFRSWYTTVLVKQVLFNNIQWIELLLYVLPSASPNISHFDQVIAHRHGAYPAGSCSCCDV